MIENVAIYVYLLFQGSFEVKQVSRMVKKIVLCVHLHFLNVKNY